MIELIRSNDAVKMSFIRSLLREAAIPFDLLDQNMSIMEGSLGVLQQRLMVDEEHLQRAQKLLRDVNIEPSKGPD